MNGCDSGLEEVVRVMGVLPIPIIPLLWTSKEKRNILLFHWHGEKMGIDGEGVSRSVVQTNVSREEEEWKIFEAGRSWRERHREVGGGTITARFLAEGREESLASSANLSARLANLLPLPCRGDHGDPASRRCSTRPPPRVQQVRTRWRGGNSVCGKRHWTLALPRVSRANRALAWLWYKRDCQASSFLNI